MSRNLLIFGQGSMACHPFIRKEFYAVAKNDKKAFQEALFGHAAYFIQNTAKALWGAFGGTCFTVLPEKYLPKAAKSLVRLSYAFAFLADATLITLGGDLKRRERVSARLADGLSFLYMAQAVLRMLETQEGEADEMLHANWALSYCFYHAQKSLLAMCDNYPIKMIGKLMRFIAFPFGQTFKLPSDKDDRKLASLMGRNNHFRDRLKELVYLSGKKAEPIDKMEDALQLIIKHEALAKKFPELRKVKFGALKARLLEKVAAQEMTAEEMEALLSVENARFDAILVDEFDFEAIKKQHFASLTNKITSPFML